jgi:hypothetical protein
VWRLDVELQSCGLRPNTSLEFLKLRFQGVDALREFLPAFLIPLGHPACGEGAHQGHDGSSNEETCKTQADHDRKPKHQSDDSIGIAAYASTETEYRQSLPLGLATGNKRVY